MMFYIIREDVLDKKKIVDTVLNDNLYLFHSLELHFQNENYEFTRLLKKNALCPE